MSEINPLPGPATVIRPARWRRIGRLFLPAVVVSALYFLFVGYPPLRILSLVRPDWQPDTPTLLVVLVLPILLRLAAERLPGAPGRMLAAVVMTWFGIAFVAFLPVLGFELVNALSTLSAVPLPLPFAGFIVLAIAVLLALVGLLNAQRLVVRDLDVAVPSALSSQVKGLRLVQVSDVHVGSRSGRFLERIVHRVNTLQADVVLITGDLVDFAKVAQEELASLAALRAPVFFAIGNHERYVDLEDICARLTNLGVRVLRNADSTLGALQIVGIDDADPRTQVGRILPFLTPDPERYRVLMYHRPDGAQYASDWGVHLMLCGHTHNGQIVPFHWLVRRVFPRICGIYRVDSLTLHVSPGTGTWGPVLRLGSRCEITRITLV
ncbi:MAG: metallophosphoesterase [Pseudomonadales bacterium]